MEGADAVDRLEQGRSQRRLERGLRRRQLCGGRAPGLRRGVDPVEAPRRLGHCMVAALGHVGDQRADAGPGGGQICG
jgi:hypothetical protein